MKKIECTYGTECFISVVSMDEQPILLLDFNLKSFKVCDNGWHDHNFPENIIVNDKIYLNEYLKDKVVKVLDGFIETGFLQDSELERNTRGFGYLNLKDLNGNEISIQESSSAMSAKIWFGCDTDNKAYIQKNGILEQYKFPRGDVLLSDRLHLDIKKAKQLKRIIIQEWDNNLSNAPNKKMKAR